MNDSKDQVSRERYNINDLWTQATERDLLYSLFWNLLKTTFKLEQIKDLNEARTLASDLIQGLDIAREYFGALNEARKHAVEMKDDLQVTQADISKIIKNHTNDIYRSIFPSIHIVSSFFEGRFWRDPKTGRIIFDDEISELPLLSDKQFKLIDETLLEKMRLTPTYMAEVIIPYILAMEKLQQILDSILNKQSSKIRINFITQGSVNVSLDGAARVIEVIREIITPWRRRLSVEVSRATVIEKRAQAQKAKAEAKRVESEVVAENQVALIKAQAEAERLVLENEKIRLELYEKRIKLALDILNKFNPELSEKQRNTYTNQLLEPLKVLTESSLLLVDRVE